MDRLGNLATLLALKEQEDAAARLTEAEAELQTVTELAAVGSTVSMACQMAGLVSNLFGPRASTSTRRS